MMRFKTWFRLTSIITYRSFCFMVCFAILLHPAHASVWTLTMNFAIKKNLVYIFFWSISMSGQGTARATQDVTTEKKIHYHYYRGKAQVMLAINLSNSFPWCQFYVTGKGYLNRWMHKNVRIVITFMLFFGLVVYKIF